MKNLKIFKSGFYEKLKLLLVLLGVLIVGINQAWATDYTIYVTGALFGDAWDDDESTIYLGYNYYDGSDKWKEPFELTNTGKTYEGSPIYSAVVNYSDAKLFFKHYQGGEEKSSYQASDGSAWTNVSGVAGKIYRGYIGSTHTWATYGRDITVYAVPESMDGSKWTEGNTLKAVFKYGDQDSEKTDKLTFTKTDETYKGNYIYKSPSVLIPYNVIKKISFYYNDGSDKDLYDLTPGSQYGTDDIDGKIFLGYISSSQTWVNYGRDVTVYTIPDYLFASYETKYDESTHYAGVCIQMENGSTWDTENMTKTSYTYATYPIYKATILIKNNKFWEYQIKYFKKSDDTQVDLYQFNKDEPKTEYKPTYIDDKIYRGYIDYSHVFTPYSYDLALNQQGGSSGSSSVIVAEGSAMPAATMPTKTGYTFGGYYDAVGGGGTQYYAANGSSATNWDNRTTTTLYAKWTETVTLNNQSADEGKGGSANFTATYNSSTGLTAITKPQKTGYIFSGYYTLAYGSGSQIINADGNFNTSVTGFITEGKWTRPAGSAVTLYAYWKKASSAGKYTFRYYEYGKTAYNVESFTGDDNERVIENFTIPTQAEATPMFFVGYNEDFYESELGEGGTKTSSVRMDWTTAYSETDGVGNGAMKLLPGSSAVGLASGAVGTLKIWTEDKHKNLSIGFLPNGYGLTYAAGTIAFNNWSSTFCETNVVTLTSADASGNFQVKLATSDSYVACAHGTSEAASAVNTRKISGGDDIANGKKGVFQMWTDASANNFGLRFVTVHDVTFNMQGHGSAISAYENVRYNDKIGAPSAPTQAGYSFGGWYKDEDCTDDWDFANDVVTENTTLYAKWTPQTLTFVGGHEGNEWNEISNWSPACIPTIDHDVILQANATLYGRFGGVSGHGRAKSIKIDKSVEGRKNIRLSIWTCSSLIVAEDIKAKHIDDADYGAVNAEDLYIETTVLGNGVLICGSANANTAATYDFHSKAYKADNKWYINQYVGIPFAELDADKMRGFNIFVYDDAEDDWRTPGSNTMNPWTAYDLLCIYPGGVGNQELKGTLLFPGTGAGKTKALSPTRRNPEDGKWTVPHPFPTSIDEKSGHQDHMFANSWTAPIDIAAMEASDFTHLVHTIYIFNAGYEGEGAKKIGDDAGQWSSFPLASVKAGLIANAVIPATQAFLVTDTASGSSITLDYKKHVYVPAKASSDANDTINNFPTRAPKRTTMETSLNSLKMFVRSEEDVIADRLYIIEGNNLRTDTFDNGWDGNKIMGESFAPQLYAMSDGSKMAVNAVKDMEGMKIGFKAGTSAQDYTLSFDYDEQAEPLYLYDNETNAYTEITNDATYEFTTSDRKAHERFLLTRSNAPQIATGVEEIDTENIQRAQKFMHNQQIFIRRGDKVYSIDGALVK